jgi:phage tail-like protein
MSSPLDSGIYRCPWHRIRLRVQLPPATSLRVSTYSSDESGEPGQPPVIADQDWRPMGTVRPGDNDLLILGGPGRFLWVRLDLAGDGYSTPSVSSLRLEYPRNSYLRFLPAVYSADQGSADFLGRYLAIAQASIENIETGLANMPALFDPLAVPDQFVDYLAGWLNVPVEGTWDSGQRRQLIDAARGYFRKRGTPAAIREHVAAYLRSMTGVTLPADGLPQLVEGFRQRRYRTLPSGEGSQRPLWSLAITARLQADRFDRLGRVRLVSAGDPQLDMFTEHAYRFSVFVPAGFARKPQDRQVLRRAISAESPAYTQGELVLVRPAMCLGIQSHLGLDSMLAAASPLRLTCAKSIQDAQAMGEEAAGCRLDGLAVLGTSRTYRSWRLGQPNLAGSLLPVS